MELDSSDISQFSRHYYRLFWSNSDFLLKIRPILEFLPKKVRFRTKVWENLTIWEHLGRYRNLSGNFDLFKTLQTNLSFIQFYREQIDQKVLIEQDRLKKTISRDVTNLHHQQGFKSLCSCRVKNQTIFGPFFLKKSDFEQKSKKFRPIGNTGKGPWF